MHQATASRRNLSDFSLSDWVRNPSHANTIWHHYWNRATPFVAIHKDFGITFTADDEDEFQAQCADKRPSMLRQLKLTCLNLFVILGPDDPS